MRLGKGRGSERMAASVIRRPGMTGQSAIEGRWNAKCFSGLTLSDPEKACRLIARSDPAFDQRRIDRILHSGVMHQKVLSGSASSIRRELESLVSGGGHLKWENDWKNLVVNSGLDHYLDVALSAGAQITSWYLGLLAASPTPLATWTPTEIAANDFVDYDEANLVAWSDGGVSGQSVDNSASTANFSINQNASSIGGAFLISTNAKATPAGTLLAAGAFTGGNKAADDGDTLQVTATFTMAAA